MKIIKPIILSLLSILSLILCILGIFIVGLRFTINYCFKIILKFIKSTLENLKYCTNKISIK